MGSQFLDLYLVDPELPRARLRGDFPDLADTIYAASAPPDPALRPAFEVMARGTFVFLPKGATHPDGLFYNRAFEHLLAKLGRRRACLEYYPDEGEYPLWELGYGKCEADWLDLPRADSGIPTIGWRSPATCRALSYSIGRALAEGSFNPRYSPEATLREAVAALDEGSSSEYGLFAIFQG